jgi:hypothetical protein
MRRRLANADAKGKTFISAHTNATANSRNPPAWCARVDVSDATGWRDRNPHGVNDGTDPQRMRYQLANH